MSHYDSDSPATSESQTQPIPSPSPCIPSRVGGNASGSAPMSGMMPGMAGMMQQPQMAGMMPGYYNMPGMMPGYYNMPGMMSQMQQTPGMMPQTPGMMPQTQPGMMPQMQPGMMPQMQPGMMPQMQQGMMMPQMQQGMMMPQMQQGSTAAGGGSRQSVPQPLGDNVYRPYMDLLCSDSPQRTSLETRTDLETQFPGAEMFSFEELGISPRRSPPTQPAAPPARTRRPGKSKATTSRAEDAEAGEGGGRKRTVWTIEECVALAKAWISVVEDPYVSANQVIDRMWWRISQSYLTWKPADRKAHGAEQCRKQWERLRRQLSRFAALYQKNTRLATSGMTSDDVKLLSHQQFPDSEKGFSEFKYWEVYLEVENSPKFMAGVESGWPKRTKINASGEYSSSAGSHELPEAEAEIPTPQSSSRRRRPIGHKAALRAARGSSSRSQEVQSEAPSQITPELTNLAELQMTQFMIETTEKWHAATDPMYKRMLKDGIDTMRRNLRLPPLPDVDSTTGDGEDESDDGE